MATQVADASLSPKHTILTNNSTNLEASLAVSGNYLYVVWIQSQPDIPENSDDYGVYSDVFFTVSNDYGATFSEPVKLSTGPGKTTEAKIAVSGSDVYVAWSKLVSHTYYNTNVFFTSSHDNGDTFGQILNLASGPNENNLDGISVVGSNVYVLWTGDDGIQLRISNDSGKTFSEPNIISYLWNGQLLATDHKVFIFSCQGDSFPFVSSHDRGETFDSGLNMTGDPWCLDVPKIASSGSNVFVTWTNGSSYQSPIRMLIAESRDSGRTFGNPMVLSEFTTEREGMPFFQDGISQTDIAMSGNNVYVIWNNFDGFSGNNVLFRASNDSGISFGPMINLSKDQDNSKDITVLTSGSHVCVAWTNLVTSSVFLRASNDSGQSFSDTISLSANESKSASVKIASSDANIYAIWMSNNATSEDNRANTDRINFVKMTSEDMPFAHRYPNRTATTIPFTMASDKAVYNETGIVKIKGQIPVLVEPRAVHISISYLKDKTNRFTHTVMPKSDGTYEAEIKVEDVVAATNAINVCTTRDEANRTFSITAEYFETTLNMVDSLFEITAEKYFAFAQSDIYNVPSVFWKEMPPRYDVLQYVFPRPPPCEFISYFEVRDEQGYTVSIDAVKISNNINSQFIPYIGSSYYPPKNRVDVTTNYLQPIIVDRSGKYTLSVITVSDEQNPVPIANVIRINFSVLQLTSTGSKGDIRIEIKSPEQLYRSQENVTVWLHVINFGNDLRVKSDNEKLPFGINLYADDGARHMLLKPSNTICKLTNEQTGQNIPITSEMTLEASSSLLFECNYSFTPNDYNNLSLLELTASGWFKGDLEPWDVTKYGKKTLDGKLTVSTDNISFNKILGEFFPHS